MEHTSYVSAYDGTRFACPHCGHVCQGNAAQTDAPQSDTAVQPQEIDRSFWFHDWAMDPDFVPPPLEDCIQPEDYPAGIPFYAQWRPDKGKVDPKNKKVWTVWGKPPFVYPDNWPFAPNEYCDPAQLIDLPLPEDSQKPAEQGVQAR